VDNFGISGFNALPYGARHWYCFTSDGHDAGWWASKEVGML